MSETEPDPPSVSVVVPARNEADYLPETLESLRAQTTDPPYEVIVVDGDSEDRTPEIAREFDARLVAGPGRNIGQGRHLGAQAARGEWLAFVDADTIVEPDYLEAMLAYVREEGLAAASSRCRMRGGRATLMQGVINRVFPRLERPILPGFNFFVERETYEAAGGFPDVPNEDTAFSRRLARSEPTGYCPATLVETSPRRISEAGLTGTLWHYVRLDWGRYRAGY
ncbi:glycosyltransferase [Halalkalicoccus sp. GCM10025322]|uniref:glycosyltransferase n=1 Tax=Halalkalicoccus TaxID=332246 RepID=UPI002F969E88